MTDDPLQCSAVRFDRKALSLATLLLPLLGCHHSPAARFPPGHAVLTDPAGDAVAAPNSGPAPDMVSGTADVVNGQITFAVRFARGTLDHRTTRVTIEVDVDRNQSTGRQTGVGLGIDYVIDLWAGSGAANIMQAVAGTCTVNSPCYTSVGNAPLRIGDDEMRTTMPLSAIGSADGRMAFRLMAYTSPQNAPGPTVTSDYMPDRNLPPAVIK